MSQKTCKDCNYWITTGNTKEAATLGECRRFPSAEITNANYFCAEFNSYSHQKMMDILSGNKNKD